jgi:hypothetical protein
MKIKEGNVSNSSSSSFVVIRNAITKKQLKQIKNRISQAKSIKDINQKYWKDSDAWEIKITKETIKGTTTMDNFPMEDFLFKIKVPTKFEYQ